MGRVPDAPIGGKAPDGVLVLSQRSIPVSGHFTQHVNDPGPSSIYRLREQRLLFIYAADPGADSATTGCCNADKQGHVQGRAHGHEFHMRGESGRCPLLVIDFFICFSFRERGLPARLCG